MGRRYRRKNGNSIVSIVVDVVHITSRLPWWGALLTWIAFYILISIVLGGYIESRIAAQANSTFYPIVGAWLGRFVHVCNWVGTACFIAGLIFVVRNYFVASYARRNEKGIVTIISKLIGRSID